MTAVTAARDSSHPFGLERRATLEIGIKTSCKRSPPASGLNRRQNLPKLGNELCDTKRPLKYSRQECFTGRCNSVAHTAVRYAVALTCTLHVKRALSAPFSVYVITNAEPLSVAVAAKLTGTLVAPVASLR